LRRRFDDESVVVGHLARKVSFVMTTRGGFRPVELMGDENELSVVTLERLERRIGEECGQLRLDISGLRTEVADRSLSMVKWLLAFFVAQTAALGTLMAAFR
jgi:hypothetical protein